MRLLKKSCIHIYTGPGKGKTTAAFGLALRAAGAGLRVYIAQFAKGSDTGELTLLKKLSKKITIRQFGARSFIRRSPTKIDCTLAANGLIVVEKIVQEGRYDLVILDEACFACWKRMVPVDRLIELIKNRPSHVEMVLTGRNAPKELFDIADLVTEMREVKHYFKAGVKARKGIEF